MIHLKGAVSLAELRLSHVIAGFVAVLVGYAGSVAIIYQATLAAGATPEQSCQAAINLLETSTSPST